MNNTTEPTILVKSDIPGASLDSLVIEDDQGTQLRKMV